MMTSTTTDIHGSYPPGLCFVFSGLSKSQEAAMKPWRPALAFMGMVLSLMFCLPVIVRETRGGKIDYTNKRLLIQLAVLLGDIALGCITLVLCLLRSDCLVITSLFVVSCALLPTIIEVGFAAVPVFVSWCCCFGMDRCLVADTRLKVIKEDASTCQSCQPWDFIEDEYTLFFMGSCLVLICLVFLISTTCFWRSSFMKEENKLEFFLQRDRSRRLSTGKYVKQGEDFQATVMP